MARLYALHIFAAVSFTRCFAFTPTTLIQQPLASSTPFNEVAPSANPGDWAAAKLSLRNPSCCVVSVTGLDDHLSVLQQYFCGPDAPGDLDLRMKVRCGNNDVQINGMTQSYEDCYKIYKSIVEPSSVKDSVNEFAIDLSDESMGNDHPCVLALEALAKGVASMADGPLEGKCKDVHMRVVCASTYEAHDPSFHTDKCPLRGYVTLTGPGTEFMDRPCLPWEYVSLRTMGAEDATSVDGLRMADELEFIVMKGDYYDAPIPDETKPSLLQSMLGKVWTRDAACVHRSPPAGEGRAKRRVILSLDLADGGDDQEWYEYNKKRGWRSGMTQRKSRLVA
jgi:hypothetical protein